MWCWSESPRIRRHDELLKRKCSLGGPSSVPIRVSIEQHLVFASESSLCWTSFVVMVVCGNESIFIGLAELVEVWGWSFVQCLFMWNKLIFLDWHSEAYYLNPHLTKRTWVLIFEAASLGINILPSIHNFRVFSITGVLTTTHTSWFLLIAAKSRGQVLKLYQTDSLLLPSDYWNLRTLERLQKKVFLKWIGDTSHCYAESFAPVMKLRTNQIFIHSMFAFF